MQLRQHNGHARFDGRAGKLAVARRSSAGKSLPGTGASKGSFEEELVRAILRTPYWALSLLLHVIVYLMLYSLVFLEPPPSRDHPLMVAFPRLFDEEVIEQDPWTFEVPPAEIPDPTPELEETLPPLEEDEGALLPREDRLASFEARTLQREAFDPGDLGRLGFDEEIWGTPFGRYVSSLRERGLDVVFLFDSTSSMWSVIDAVKERLGWMISVLHALVPGFRLGMATYRDHGDEYVVRAEPLTQERYRLMARLQSVHAAGGGDLEEAVLEGLQHCTRKMKWSPHSQKVIILIGDAPPHPAEVRRTLEIARSFHRRGGVVHAVIALASEDRDASESDRETAEIFQRIARAGGGSTVFLEDATNVVGELLVLSFGGRWRTRILRAYETYLARGTWRDRVIRAKIAAGDLDALVRKLRIPPVYPGLIRALVEVEDPSLASRLLPLIGDRSLPSENRWAAVYLVARLTGRVVEADEMRASLPPRAIRARRTRRGGK